MCRRNQFCGFVLIAFGTGIFLGKWIASGFLCVTTGIAALLLGCYFVRSR